MRLTLYFPVSHILFTVIPILSFWRTARVPARRLNNKRAFRDRGSVLRPSWVIQTTISRSTAFLLFFKSSPSGVLYACIPVVRTKQRGRIQKQPGGKTPVSVRPRHNQRDMAKLLIVGVVLLEVCLILAQTTEEAVSVSTPETPRENNEPSVEASPSPPPPESSASSEDNNIQKDLRGTTSEPTVPEKESKGGAQATLARNFFVIGGVLCVLVHSAFL